MIKKVLMLTVCLMTAMFLLGNNKQQYVERIEYVMVGCGDTRDGIAGKFYRLDERGVCWDEFRYEIGKLNENLSKNGRPLMPGDVIEIRYYAKQ